MARSNMALLVAALGLLVVGCAAGPYAPYTSCRDYIAGSGNTTMVAKLLNDTGLLDSLGPDFMGTVFIPWDKAVSSASKSFSKLSTDQLKNILLFHAVANRIPPTDFRKMKNVETLLPGFLATLGYQAGKPASTGKGGTVTPAGPPTFMVEKAKVLSQRAIGACKAYLIDTVLIPDAKANAKKFLDIKSIINQKPELSDIKALLEKEGLIDELGSDFEGTVFLPSNAAVQAAQAALGGMSDAALTRALLYAVGAKPLTLKNFTSTPTTYYSIQGLALKLGQVGKKVAAVNNITISSDFTVGKAAAFIIDNVLVPKPARTLTMVDCAMRNPELSIAADLVKRFPDLAAKLSYDFIGSVFLPRNTAFTGVDLNAIPPADLEKIVKYHIAEGKTLRGGDFTKLGNDVPTLLDGATVRLTKTGVSPKVQTFVNNIPTQGNSTGCGFGTLYMIDTYLSPPSA